LYHFVPGNCEVIFDVKNLLLDLIRGDYLEVERQDSELVLKLVKGIHPGQTYFNSEGWQEAKKRRRDTKPRPPVIIPKI
jgi:hypothetical protein